MYKTIALIVLFASTAYGASTEKLLHAMDKFNVGTPIKKVEAYLGEPIFKPNENISYYDSNKICYKSKAGEANCGLIIEYINTPKGKIISTILFGDIRE